MNTQYQSLHISPEKLFFNLKTNCFFRKKAVFSILFFLALLSFSAQSFAKKKDTPKEMFVEAESYFLFEDYKEALPLYQRVFRAEPNNYNVYYKIGVCYLNDIYNKKKSIPYLEEASKHINKEYKLNSYKEKLAPPEALFDLAVAYRKTGHLEKAIETFNHFKVVADEELYNIDLIEEEIQACKYAIQLRKNVLLVEKYNNLEINSKYAEHNPVISGNGKVMAFVRILPFYEGVFITKRTKEGTWTEPVNLTGFFGLDGNSYCTGLSYDGDEIYVYRSDNFDGNIYVSYNKKGKWSPLERLGPNINTKYWESHASPSPDGKYLYFTSNRKGGYGGLDIYRAKKQSRGNWGEIENLGPVINSKYNEDTPFLTSNGKKLYFSSAGHESSGGYDIFSSTLNKNNNWETPVNIGYPFNTADDELFYCPAPNDEWGYFAMFDPETSKGLLDIYYVTVFEDKTIITEEVPNKDKSKLKFSLRGKIKSLFNSNPDFSKLLIFLTDKDGAILDSTLVSPDGTYNFTTTAGEYNLMVKGEGIETTIVPVVIDASQTYAEGNIIDITIDFKGEQINSGNEAEAFLIEKKEIVVSDGKKVSIPLICSKRSKFKIAITQGDSIIGNIDYTARKENPIFTYKPIPGENVLTFSMMDAETVIAKQVVTIFNSENAPEDEQNKTKDVYFSSTTINQIKNLASANLKEYLDKAELPEKITLPELQKILYQEAAVYNFTTNDVDIAIACFLTQKTTIKFVDEFNINKRTFYKYNEDSLERTPVVMVDNYRKIANETSLNKLLFTQLNDQFDSLRLTQNYIQSFKKYSGSSIHVSKIEGSNNATSLVNQDAFVFKPLDLAATTKDLSAYYQNLLFSAEDSLKSRIATINFNDASIDNSIDLVLYLVNNTNKFGLTSDEMLNFIQSANMAMPGNIELFIDMLSENSVGQIKSYLASVKDKSDTYTSYQDVIYDLSINSTKNGYTRKELYDLVLNLSNISTVQEAIQYIREKADSSIIASINNMPEQQMSNAFEVFQYLLANTSRYAYEEWDVCELLSRMLLENEVTNLPVINDSKRKKGKLSISNNLAHLLLALGIANALLIILFIILRKKKQTQKDKPDDIL